MIRLFWTLIKVSLVYGALAWALTTNFFSRPGNSGPLPITHQSSALSGTNLVLTSHADGSAPIKVFSSPCTVYAFLTFPKNITGQKNLLCNWINTEGEVQEQTKIHVDLEKMPAHTVDFWIKFHERDSLRSQSLGSFDPRPSAVQHWSLEVYADGILFQQAKFQVIDL